MKSYAARLKRIKEVTGWLERETSDRVKEMMLEIVCKVVGDDIDRHILIRTLREKYGKKR